MRTSFVLSAALLAAAGCTPGDLAYDHTASIGVDARGVEYTDDQSAQVGMNGATCAVNPDSANIEEDVDVLDEDDRVEDSHDGEALIANSQGVAIYEPQMGMWDSSYEPDVLVPSLQSAGFTLGGIATLDAFQGCNVTFHGDNTAVALSSDSCDGADLATSGNLDVVAASTGGQAFLVTQRGEAIVLGLGTHVALDDGGTVFTANDTTLSAYELDGSLRWSTEMAGSVVDLDVLAGHAAVMTLRGDGSGELVTYSADLGEQSSSLPTPTPSDRISASASGREIAMVLPFEIHFFEVQSL